MNLGKYISEYIFLNTVVDSLVVCLDYLRLNKESGSCHRGEKNPAPQYGLLSWTQTHSDYSSGSTLSEQQLDPYAASTQWDTTIESVLLFFKFFYFLSFVLFRAIPTAYRGS